MKRSGRQSTNIVDARGQTGWLKEAADHYALSGMNHLVNQWTAPVIQHNAVTDRMVEGVERMGTLAGLMTQTKPNTDYGPPDGPVNFMGQGGGNPPMQDQMRQQIIETAKALGISPVDLGTAISYETAGTFDPMKKGPHTQWGQHRGLIQFGEPQAKKYGVDWNNPLGSQLGPDGAVAKYLRDTGVKPGMGMMDIYSAINAGGVGPDYYGRSDANNGGAPGTVADKVNDQMAGHRAKAEQLLGGSFGAADGPKGQEAFPAMLGSMAPGGGAPGAQDSGIPMFVANHWNSLSDDGARKPNGLERLGAAVSAATKGPPPPSIHGPGGDARQSGDALMKALQNPQALAQLLMKQRLG